MPKYTQALKDSGLQYFCFLPLPTSPVNEVCHTLKRSSAIVIGGGNTNLYADYIVETPIGETIRSCYDSGIPVASFSAGALISPELCIISPQDNSQNEFQHRKGLGLVTDTVLAVHFTQWNDEVHLRKAVNQCKPSMNYGIDENACIYLLNGRLNATEGNDVYRLENDVLTKITN